VTGGCGYISSVLVPGLLGDDRVEQVVVFDSLSLESPANLASCLVDSIDFMRVSEISQSNYNRGSRS
jgi:UDP-glucose 4-epimerase